MILEDQDILKKPYNVLIQFVKIGNNNVPIK